MTELQAGKISISFTVNGAERRVEAWPMARLLDLLREDLGLTGTKEGCGEGECGACAVLIDGELVNTCLVPAVHAQGVDIVTVEGLAGAQALHEVQHAFVDHGGAQCGICTPGMILASKALLDRHPDPTPEQIREGLGGNLCRCTGYTKIYDSVVAASKTLRALPDGPATGGRGDMGEEGPT